MSVRYALVVLAVIASASAERRLTQITPEQNYAPATITSNGDGDQIIATPITPVAPYSQAAYQCNVSGDSRIPLGATYPLTVKVPVGQRARVIFANGNLGGGGDGGGGSSGTQSFAQTQPGEPGVIVQQSGSPIVQQTGGASPIVQPAGSPVVQQPVSGNNNVVQQTPTTVVQQPTYPQAPTVAQPPPSPTPPPYGYRAAGGYGRRRSMLQAERIPSRRHMLQDTVPGGPNNGLVEYVALSNANTVPGFVVPNTQFGVPYVEFTASEAARGQTAMFNGVLEVARVVGGQPITPFQRNPDQSPDCQVNVNFEVA